ncbi:MAG: hypothetical protein OXL36_14885 [Bryobacterales bacterium]|nr:hypothetical protein [Bryobacterales bacterium]MDE0295866.1 hypothetical protein [Bryobacterales bacterium]
MIRREEIEMETLPDPCPDTSYLEQEGFEERLRQLQDGRFSFMGIRASCTLHIGIGQAGHVILHRFKSPGVWNVETDSSSEHIRMLFEDERAVLLAMLDAINCQRSGDPRSAS